MAGTIIASELATRIAVAPSVCGSYTTVLRIPGVPRGLSIPIVAIPVNTYSVGWGAASGTVAQYEIEQHSNARPVHWH